MVTKILFTALIVVALVTYARHRTSSRRRAPSAAPVSAPQARSWPRRLLPFALVLALASVSGLMVWLEWQEAHQVYTVRVIDTRSGEVRTYAVYKDAVHGRSFTTIDGRVVTLADVERMELVEGAPGGG